MLTLWPSLSAPHLACIILHNILSSAVLKKVVKETCPLPSPKPCSCGCGYPCLTQLVLSYNRHTQRERGFAPQGWAGQSSESLCTSVGQEIATRLLKAGVGNTALSSAQGRTRRNMGATVRALQEPELPIHDSTYPLTAPGRIRALLCNESTRQTLTPHCLHQA